MADIMLVLPREQLGEHLVGGDGANCERRDEFFGRLGQYRPHTGAAFAQPPNEVETFIGGDTATDDQENPPAR